MFDQTALDQEDLFFGGFFFFCLTGLTIQLQYIKFYQIQCDSIQLQCI